MEAIDPVSSVHKKKQRWYSILRWRWSWSCPCAKLSICHEDVRGSRCIDPRFLDLATGWSWVASFTFSYLYPRNGAPGTLWTGGLVCPRDGLDDMEKWKFLTLPGLELQTLGRPECSQLLYRLPGSAVKVWILAILSTLLCIEQELRSTSGLIRYRVGFNWETPRLLCTFFLPRIPNSFEDLIWHYANTTVNSTSLNKKEACNNWNTYPL
jgi:hypothetical protein